MNITQSLSCILMHLRTTTNHRTMYSWRLCVIRTVASNEDEFTQIKNWDLIPELT